MGSGAPSTSRIYDAFSVAPGRDGGDRSRELDALRAVAALLVVGNHTTIWGGAPFPAPTDRSITTLVLSGGGGLSLFFALSGFLIAGPFLRSLMKGATLPETRRYALRRAARILPAYWVALAVAVVVLPRADSLDPWEILVHIGLLHNFVPGEAYALLLVAWTLALEAQFYVFVPLAAAAVHRLRRGPVDIDVLARGVLVLWAAVLVWGVFLAVVHPGTGSNVDVLRLSLPGLLSGFCPGLLVYLAETEEAANRGGAWAVYRRAVRRPVVVFGLAGIFWSAGALATSSTAWVVVDLGKHCHAIASGLALAGVYQGWNWLRFPVRVLAPIGLVSYGVYLWHWIVINGAVRFDLVPLSGHGLGRYVVHFVVIVAATLVIATASWMLIERPLIRSARRADRRRVSVPPVLPTTPATAGDKAETG